MPGAQALIPKCHLQNKSTRFPPCTGMTDRANTGMAEGLKSSTLSAEARNQPNTIHFNIKE